jgi:3-oxoacyl-[acyl-carrier protein] reductase
MKTIVLGGSKGLGFAVTRRLMLGRNDVVYLSRTKAKNDFVPAVFDNPPWIELDLSWPGAKIAQAINEAVKQLNGVDNVICSAGMGAFHGVMVGDSTIQKLFQQNVFAPIAVYQAAIRPMIKQRSGRMIFITSSSARKPGAGDLSLYAATKGAMNSWVISESRRAAKAGVGLCAVAPGYFDSDMTKDIDPIIKAKSTKAIPFKRFANADEVAAFVESLTRQTPWVLSGSIFECTGGA